MYRRYRRGYNSYRKRTFRRTGNYSFKKKVLTIIKKSAEHKLCGSNLAFNIAPPTLTIASGSINLTAAGGGLIKQFSSVQQGTGVDERIGNKIYCLRSTMRFQCNFNAIPIVTANDQGCCYIHYIVACADEVGDQAATLITNMTAWFWPGGALSANEFARFSDYKPSFDQNAAGFFVKKTWLVRPPNYGHDLINAASFPTFTVSRNPKFFRNVEARKKLTYNQDNDVQPGNMTGMFLIVNDTVYPMLTQYNSTMSFTDD